MRILEKVERPDRKATEYKVKLNDGSIVSAFKHWYKNGIFVEPSVENPRKVINFLWDSKYADDLKVYGVRRQHKNAFAPVVDYCHSRYQAEELAEMVWDGHPERWIFFEIFYDQTKIVKSYVGTV